MDLANIANISLRSQSADIQYIQYMPHIPHVQRDLDSHQINRTQYFRTCNNNQSEQQYL